MAGLELPTRAIREQVASAIDVIVQLGRLRDGTRRVTSVTEVSGMEGEVVTLQELYAFDFHAGVGEDGRFLGTCRPTGLRPAFSERLADLGIALPGSIFGSVDVFAEARGTRR
jgi:pilus assembly protein CpaF